MKGEILLQNVFYLFIIGIILESSVMAIFSMTVMKRLTDRTPVEAARDALILILAFILCYKVKILTIFRGTGIRVPYLLDTIISGLVLARMTYFIREFLSKFKQGS